MNKDVFVDSVKKYLRDTAIESVYEFVTSPPGRQISKKKRDVAEWLKTLTETENEHIKYVIEISVDQAIFDFLCTLDGVHKITKEDGEFLLSFKTSKEEIVLNDDGTLDLHDIYNAEE